MSPGAGKANSIIFIFFMAAPIPAAVRPSRLPRGFDIRQRPSDYQFHDDSSGIQSQTRNSARPYKASLAPSLKLEGRFTF